MVLRSVRSDVDERRPVMAVAVQAMVREVMDIRQASEYLGISGDTLYRYASEGFIRRRSSWGTGGGSGRRCWMRGWMRSRE